MYCIVQHVVQSAESKRLQVHKKFEPNMRALRFLPQMLNEMVFWHMSGVILYFSADFYVTHAQIRNDGVTQYRCAYNLNICSN